MEVIADLGHFVGAKRHLTAVDEFDFDAAARSAMHHGLDVDRLSLLEGHLLVVGAFNGNGAFYAAYLSDGFWLI